MRRSDPLIPRHVAGPAVARATRLGLGLAALGRPGYITLGHARDLGGDHDPEAMERHAHAVLDAAHAAGVRYVDAARSYGRAEEFLGSWLGSRGIRPGEVVVGSKWGYAYTAGWRTDAAAHEIKDHSLATFRRQLGETRERLGEHLALYQIHSATPESGVLDAPAVLDALAELRDEGVRVGLTVSGAGQADTIRRALEVRRGGTRLFGAVQATWNLLERSAGEALAEAHAAGLAVLVKEGLANGRLTERDTSPEGGRRLAPLRAEAARLGSSIDALALAAILAEPWAELVLSGAATSEQLRSNARALDVAWDDEAASRLASLVVAPAEYWSERSRLPWN